MALSQETRDWLALTLVPGVGTTLFVRLLARFGTPAEVLRSSEAALAEVVGPKLAGRIRQYRQAVDVEDQVRRMADYDANLITMDDPAYPPRLAEIYDPPLVLFRRGELHDSDVHCVSIVGTRKPTNYGKRMAARLAGDLVQRGITVLSGMASGIDAAAHHGALAAGGRTIAVLGCGVDVVYPPENAELMHQIVQQGCVLSCFPMGTKPSRGLFPHRNRIISGLTLGTLVIEAPPGSGALITAKQAAEQGHEVFALPGQAGERNSMGPHALIREGAKLVETVEDIIVELNLPAARRQVAAEVKSQVAAPITTPSLPETQKDVLAALSPDGSFVDEIAAVCHIPVSEALSSLTMLELNGLVQQFSGKRFAPR